MCRCPRTHEVVTTGMNNKEHIRRTVLRKGCAFSGCASYLLQPINGHETAPVWTVPMSRFFVNVPLEEVKGGCSSKRSGIEGGKFRLDPVPETENLEMPLVGQHR